MQSFAQSQLAVSVGRAAAGSLISSALWSPSAMGLGKVFPPHGIKCWGVIQEISGPKQMIKDDQSCFKQRIRRRPHWNIWPIIPMASFALVVGQKSPAPKAGRVSAGDAWTASSGPGLPKQNQTPSHPSGPARIAGQNGGRASAIAIGALPNGGENPPAGQSARTGRSSGWPCKQSGYFRPCIYKGLQSRFWPVRPLGLFRLLGAQNAYMTGGMA